MRRTHFSRCLQRLAFNALGVSKEVHHNFPYTVVNERAGQGCSRRNFVVKVG